MVAHRLAVATFAVALGACSGDRRSAPQARGESVDEQPAAPAPAKAPGTPVSPAPNADFGPLIGASVAVVAPSPGVFAASYAYSQTKFITTERSISTSIHGDARLELAADGTASACFGKRANRSSSVGKYASPDGKYHHDDQDDLRLIGARGTWKLDGGVARISFDRVQFGACDVTKPSSSTLEVTCVAIEPTKRLPVRALACQLAPWFGLDDLAINPADSPRAGPYTLQDDPARHTRVDRGKPWLLLGGAPGLAIESHDRDAPEVAFTAQAVSFVEREYQAAPR